MTTMTDEKEQAHLNTLANTNMLKLQVRWAIAERDAARRERDNLDKSCDEAFAEITRLREQLEEKSSEVESLFEGLLESYYEKDALYNPTWCIETATVMLASARGAVVAETTTSPATYAAIAHAAATTAQAMILAQIVTRDELPAVRIIGDVFQN